jgi:hypothetical protein
MKPALIRQGVVALSIVATLLYVSGCSNPAPPGAEQGAAPAATSDSERWQ